MLNNSYTSQSLLLFLWNANGLKNHKNELITILYEKRIDIALITETHFAPNTKFSIPGYKLISAPHPDNTAHAGSAILIKSSLQFNTCPIINEDFLQAAIITLKTNHISISIAATYCPPKHRITTLQYQQFFMSLERYFLVGGDLNAKNPAWGCHTQNPKGQALHHLINIKNFKVLSPTNPTYWPTSPRKRPDILDIFVVNIPNNISHSIKNLLDPCSDHSPVLLTLDAQPLP